MQIVHSIPEAIVFVDTERSSHSGAHHSTQVLLAQEGLPRIHYKETNTFYTASVRLVTAVLMMSMLCGHYDTAMGAHVVALQLEMANTIVSCVHISGTLKHFLLMLSREMLWSTFVRLSGLFSLVVYEM